MVASGKAGSPQGHRHRWYRLAASLAFYTLLSFIPLVALIVIGFASFAATDQTLFVGTRFGGVFRSTDGGDTWSEVNSGLTDTVVFALDISSEYATDQTLFVGTFGGVFRSTDGGDTWSEVNSGLITLPVYALSVSPGYATDQTLFAGTYFGGVFRSTDGGDTRRDEPTTSHMVDGAPDLTFCQDCSTVGSVDAGIVAR